MEGIVLAPPMRLFGLCATVLVLKMMAVGAYTSVLRIRRRVYATPEDYRIQGLPPQAATDEEVERARRAHRNDLENILPFFAVGFFYALVTPSTAAAAVGFIGFTLARVLHSVFYLRATQPHRTVAFMVGALLMLWMTVETLVRLAA